MSKVARPTKRVRLSTWESGGGTPRRSGGVSDLDMSSLLRVLKLLERSVRVGETIEPFGCVPRREQSLDTGNPDGKRPKGKKKAMSAIKDRTKSPRVGDDDKPNVVEVAVDGDEIEFDDDAFPKLERDLESARDSILAVDCCLALLNSDRLPKQVMASVPPKSLSLFLTGNIGLL